MITTKLITYYLIPKQETRTYSKDASLNFVYRKGYESYAMVTLADDSVGYVALEQLETSVTDWSQTLEDFLTPILEADVTILTELPKLKKFLNYCSLDNGGYYINKVILSYRKTDREGTPDLLVGKHNYDMRALADRTLVTFNGMAHRTLNSPKGNSLLVLNGTHTLSIANESSGLIFTHHMNRMISVGNEEEHSVIEDGVLKLKMNNSSFITDMIENKWTPKLVFLGQLSFDVDITWDEVEGVLSCAVSDLNSREILQRVGYLLFPEKLKYREELTDDVYNILMSVIPSHYLNYLVLIDSENVEMQDVPMISRKCSGAYKIKGLPEYPMVNSEQVMFDYDRDYYDMADQTVITPRVRGIETEAKPKLPTEVSSQGNLRTDTVAHHVYFRCISY